VANLEHETQETDRVIDAYFVHCDTAGEPPLVEGFHSWVTSIVDFSQDTVVKRGLNRPLAVRPLNRPLKRDLRGRIAQ
jgi:hypothetical protein